PHALGGGRATPRAARLRPRRRRGPRAPGAAGAPPFHAACRQMLPNAKAVVDRFHVAKKFNEAIDGQRKKNHAGLQEEAVESRAEGVPLADVGVPPPSAGPVGGREGEVGGAVRAPAPAAAAVRVPGALPCDL